MRAIIQGKGYMEAHMPGAAGAADMASASLHLLYRVQYAGVCCSCDDVHLSGVLHAVS